MSTATAPIVLADKYRATSEYLVLSRHGDDKPWTLGFNKTYADRGLAEDCVRFMQMADEGAIAKYGDEKIADGLDLDTTHGHKTLAQRRTVLAKAQTAQYLIVGRDVPAFAPLAD